MYSPLEGWSPSLRELTYDTQGAMFVVMSHAAICCNITGLGGSFQFVNDSDWRIVHWLQCVMCMCGVVSTHKCMHKG